MQLNVLAQTQLNVLALRTVRNQELQPTKHQRVIRISGPPRPNGEASAQTKL